MDWNKKTAFFKTASIFLLVCAVLFPVGRFFILRDLTDPQTGVFLKNSFWATLFDYLFFALIVFFFILTTVFRPRFLSPEEQTEKLHPPVSFMQNGKLTAGSELVFSPNGSVRVFASAFLGFSLITFSVFIISESVPETPLDWAEQVLAILSGVFFLAQYSRLLPFYSARRALASLVPLVWATVKLFNCFLTASRNPTGENQNWQILSLALIAVFLYAQSQFNLPKRSTYHYGLLFFSGMLGLCAILTYTLPILVLFAFPASPYDAYSRIPSVHDLIVQIASAFYLGAYAFSSAQRLGRYTDERALCDPGEFSD